MTIEHKVIPDAQRHEPRGASTAVTGQAPVSNGDGSTTFRFVDYATLLNRPIFVGYTGVLLGSSTSTNQQPSATNTALQVEFGPANTTTDVSLSAAGVLTFNTAGQYIIQRKLRVSRTAATGTANLFVRTLVNGTQDGVSSAVIMDNNLDASILTDYLIYGLTAGATVSTEIIRDSSGINNGGLFSAVPVASGWNSSPTASITVYKYRGAT